MNKEIKRAIIAAVVFVVVYVVFGLLIKFKSYDIYVDAIRILSAVIGAGSYWVGSKE